MARRRFSGADLVLASHNRGKLKEIAELVAPFGVTTVSAGDLGLPEPDETGDSFVANAELKARAAALATGRMALADDSGMAVDALDGAPGIYSARWAPGGDFAKAMERVWREVQAKSAPPLSAHFICALSLCWPDGHCETFQGEVSGVLVYPPLGRHGFGYDPMFRPIGEQDTFGEMDPARKHAMSHRARAFKQLIDGCFRPA